MILRALQTRKLPAVSKCFPAAAPDLSLLRVHNAIGVKYDAAEKKTEMPPQMGAYTTTANIALTNPSDFEESGTWIQALTGDGDGGSRRNGAGSTIHLKQGGGLIVIRLHIFKTQAIMAP